MIEKTDWEVFAANMLKSELKRKGVTYAQLADMIDDKEVNIRNKLARGKFTAAFLLHCLSAIGVHELRF
ncbi:DUF6471 domain-containing protein [Cypionkella sinensis]|uniref:DUF6471 domain-containing protein n=1 Tax=Cypionkella sinensis TaxID=1756043 RepID=A0ABV7J4G6_9RHOB